MVNLTCIFEANNILALAAVAVAGVAYCDARFHISRDLSVIWTMKRAERATIAAGVFEESLTQTD